MKKLVLTAVLSVLLLTACDNGESVSNNINSESVLKTFQDANLPTTDPRDNSHNCDSLGCVSVITTEDVSIYEWNTETEASKQAEVGIGNGNYSKGKFYIRANNDEIDFEKYKTALDNLVSNQ